jgi:BA14K-like protein
MSSPPESSHIDSNLQSWLRDRMTRLLALPVGAASRICALCSVLLMLTGAAARAQSADPATPPAPAQPSVQDQATGTCEPIGLTASGEIVFPFRCKDMVERQRADVTKPSEPKPAVATTAPAVQETHQAKLQAKPQAQPVAAAAKMTAVHPVHATNAKPVAIHPASAVPESAKPAAQPVDAAHGPKNREKGVEKTVDAKPANAKPAEAKTADVKTAEARPVETKPVETTKSIPQVAGKAREHRKGPPGCTQFQSYNAVSATYLGFDGQRHPCGEAAGQVVRKQVAGTQAARTQSPHKPSPADIKH